MNKPWLSLDRQLKFMTLCQITVSRFTHSPVWQQKYSSLIPSVLCVWIHWLINKQSLNTPQKDRTLCVWVLRRPPRSIQVQIWMLITRALAEGLKHSGHPYYVVDMFMNAQLHLKKTIQTLLIPMLMESWVKFHNPQNISEALQQNSAAAFRGTFLFLNGTKQLTRKTSLV